MWPIGNEWVCSSDLVPNRGEQDQCLNRPPDVKFERMWDRVWGSDPMRQLPPTGPCRRRSLLPLSSGLREFFASSSKPRCLSRPSFNRLWQSYQTIAFGRPIGVTINYAPDRAVRYDLTGDPVETLAKAIRCGEASHCAADRGRPRRPTSSLYTTYIWH
jgi:hypothetical protein